MTEETIEKAPAPEWLDDAVVLLGEYGSRALGVGIETSDRDLIGAAVPPREYVLGLAQFSTYRFADRADTNRRSSSDETEGAIYPLRELVRLAAAGNPSILISLFLPDYDRLTGAGRALIDARDTFLHREAGARFLGFMNEQRAHMYGADGRRVSRRRKPTGYTAKKAYTMVRAGLHGVHYLTDGVMPVPLPDDERRLILDIRHERIGEAEVLKLADDIEARLTHLREHADLPERADWDTVNRLLVDLHEQAWAETA